MTWPLKSESAKCQATIKAERYNMLHTIKIDINRLLASFLPAWKVKNHFIYVPRCPNDLHVINIWKYLKSHCIHKLRLHRYTYTPAWRQSHKAPLSWMVKCHYSWQSEWAEGQPVIYWRVLTLKCVIAVNRLPITISPALQTDGRLGNTTDCTVGFHIIRWE